MGRYPLEVFWSDEDEGFIVEAPDLPGCSAFGADETEAVREAQDAIAAWIEAAKAAGRAIPAPSKLEPLTAYSGKFLVRIGRELHQRLTRDAHSDGLSLNQYALKLLSRGASRAQAKEAQRTEQVPAMLVAHKALGASSRKVAHRGTARKSASKRGQFKK